MRLLRLLSIALVLSCACRGPSDPGSGSAGTPATATGSKNVVLVTVDTLRADHVGAYGDRAARTPTLDALAREGVLFEQAIAQVPVTLPSHASLMTGLLPPVHGVRDNTYFRLDEQADTLAEMLRDRGYRTAAFVGAFVLASEFGLAQGFDVYDELDEEGREGEIAGTFSERRGAEVVDAFTEWLDARDGEGDAPFFAWVHLFDPHLPYAPPTPFPQSYEGEIAYVDEQIGRMRAALETSGRFEDTIFVVTADHGESLGEHGEKSHGFFVYDATLRIPWIMTAPGLVEPGTRVEAQVTTVDFLPTLAGLLGLEPPASVEGVDVLAPNAATPAAYAECYVSLFNFHWAPLVAIREDGFKYIDAPEAELYDLEADPDETANLLRDDPERARAMKAKLAALVASRATTLSARGQPDQETVERLRALGYTGGAPSISPGPAQPADSGAPPELADPKHRLHLWRLMEEVILDRSRGELPRAIESAEAVLREDPSNLLALELLAQMRTKQGDVPSALALYERANTIDGSRPTAQLQQGELALRLGDAESAERRFRRAIELDPGLSRARRRLGELQLATGRPEEALATFALAIDRSPDDVEASLGAARSLRATGDASGALDALERLAREHPESPAVLAEYAGTIARAGRMSEAVALLEGGPEHHDVHYTLSVLHRSANRMEAALAELDRALALIPDSAVALHDRGVLLSRDGRLDEAVTSLARALALRDVPATRNALGAALCRMERCAEGVVHFEHAVEEAPAFRDALENLAMGYRVLGRTADAERIDARLRSLGR